MKKIALFLGISLALVGFIAMVSVSQAAMPGSRDFGGFGGRGIHGQGMGVFGSVTAINGNTLTVASKGFGPNATPTTYTVDASKATVTKNNSAATVADIAVNDQVAIRGTISGSNITATSIRDGIMRPAYLGIVTAISGNTLTITAQGRGNSTTYTVDASNAKVTKNGSDSAVSAIAVNDKIMVQGTLSGTTITATSIRDGLGSGEQPLIQGNGQPVIGGTVSAISGSSLTVTTATNISYTIDASSAKIVQGKTSADISSLKIGDKVIVQGKVNGTSVTASSIIDQSVIQAKANAGHDFFGNMFRGIGGFFHNIFKFF